MSLPCSPTCFVAALSALRVECGYNTLGLDEEEGLERLLRCQGLDMLAGEWCAELVRGGIDPWRLISALAEAVQAVIPPDAAEGERTRAQLILGLVPVLRTIPNLSHTDALGELLDFTKEHWEAKSRLSKLACSALLIATCVNYDGDLVPEHVNVEVREFVRDAFDYGGLPTVQAVVESLRAQLGEVQP